MEEKLKLKVKYHTDIEPLKITENGDWIDLRVAESIFIPEGSFALVSLGVSVQLPDGYEAHIVPRSSTFKNYGIIQTNHMGIIDNSYCGDNDIYRFPAYCIKGKHEINNTKGTVLQKNDRICQMRIVKKMPQLEIEEVETLGNKDRGGFGSTGKN